MLSHSRSIDASSRSVWIAILSGAALLAICSAIDARVSALFWRSLMLAMGSTAIAFPIGFVTGAILSRIKVVGSSILAVGICSSAMLPLVITAAAWDAGFGRMGWWQWPIFGDMQGRLLEGMIATVWIHAMAGTPWIVLLTIATLGQRDQSVEDSLMIDGGTGTVIVQTLKARLLPLFGLASLWMMVTTLGEMTVTDLFAVRTIAEEIYLGLPTAATFAAGNVLVAEEGHGWVLSPAMLMIFAWVTCCAIVLIRLVAATASGAILRPAKPEANPSSRWWANILIVLVTLLLLGAPIANLLIKAGFVVELAEGGGIPTWKAARFLSTISDALTSYHLEFMWTFLIALFSTLLTLVIFGPISWWAYSSRSVSIAFVLLNSILMAIPGPLIGVMLIEILNQDHSLFIYIYDRTIVPPVLACTCRIGPWIGVLLWAIWLSLSPALMEAARGDGAGRIRMLLSMALPQRWRLIVAASCMSFILSLGELSATLLVLPPGMDTLPRIVFGQLHAGVYDQVAAICLLQWAGFVVVVIATMLIWKWGTRASERSSVNDSV